MLPNLLSPEQEGRWTAEELVQALSSLRSSVRRQSMNYPASAKLFGSDSIAPPCERCGLLSLAIYFFFIYFLYLFYFLFPLRDCSECAIRGTVSMRLPATTSMPTLEKESTRSRAQSCIFTGPTGRADDANQLPLGRVSPPPPPRPPRPAHLRSNSPQPPLVHVSLSVPCGVALPPAPLTPVLLPVPVDSTDDLANVASTDLPADPATDSISSPPPRPPRPVHNTSPIPAKVVVGEIMKEPVVVHETHHDLHLPRPKALEALEAVRFKQLDTAEVLAQANSGRQDLVKKSIPALVLLLKFGALGIQEQAVAALGVLVLDEQSRKIIAAAGAIVPLVQVLKEGPECLKEETAWVLRNLALDVQNIKLFRSTDAITALVALLKSGTDGARYQAAAALRNQAEDVKSRKAIAEAGAIPLLVQLLSAEAEDAQVQAAGALESLAEVAANVKTIVAAGAVDPLVQLLRDGSTNYAQEAAAAALMSFGADCVANAKTVAATGVIPLLVKLLREGTEVGKEKAAGTLRNLAIEAENKKLIAAEGAIPLLVHLLRDGSADVQLASAGALRNLAVEVQNKHIIAAEGGIPPLVHLLSEGSDQAKGIAVVALQNLVDSCEENLVLLRAASAVEPLWALKMSGIYGVSFASKLLTLLE